MLAAASPPLIIVIMTGTIEPGAYPESETGTETGAGIILGLANLPTTGRPVTVEIMGTPMVSLTHPQHTEMAVTNHHSLH